MLLSITLVFHKLWLLFKPLRLETSGKLICTRLLEFTKINWTARSSPQQYMGKVVSYMLSSFYSVYPLNGEGVGPTQSGCSGEKILLLLGVTALGGPWPPQRSASTDPYFSPSPSVHPLIPILLRSAITSSSHLILCLPILLIVYSFPFSTLFGMAVSSILSTWSSHCILCAFINLTIPSPAMSFSQLIVISYSPYPLIHNLMFF